MPIYEFKCDDNHHLELVMSWEQSKLENKCCVKFADGFCNKPLTKQVSRPSMQPDSTWHTGLYSLALDKEFKTKKEMDNYLKNKGLATAKSNDITTMSSLERIEKNVSANDNIRNEIVERDAKIALRDFV